MAAALVEPLARARAADRFGGKAAQLSALMDVPGVRVPPGFAVAAEAFHLALEATLPAAQRPERLLAGPAHERRGDRLAAIRARLLGAPIAEKLQREISAAYLAMGEGVVAVRSSALHEDTEGTSAAGLQETILGVAGEAALFDAVRRCFASIFDERALAYLARQANAAGRAHGGAHAPAPRIGVAVVVQRLVEADAAGVLFTVDPVARDAPDAVAYARGGVTARTAGTAGKDANAVMVVEAAHGLGCAVVDGSLAPDVFRVARATGAVESERVGEKPFKVVARDGGGLERVPLPPPEAARPALDAAQLAELARTGRAIEHAAGSARDIEWAYERGVLWVLQSRPIVAAAGQHTGDRASWVWSNVNVGEALPGVCTPLTWSVAVAFSDQGFRQAFGALGCTVPPDAELVGRFHGRIYLNLTTFMKIAGQVPALDPRLLLEFGGGGGLEVLEGQIERGSWLRFLPRAPGVAARFVTENASLGARLDRFERDFAQERRAFETRDLSAARPRELLELLDRLAALLDRTGTLMLACASGHLSSVVALRALLHAVARADASRLERALLTGIADVESAAPGIALVHLAELARREPAARDALMGADAAALTAASLPREGPTRRAFESFLRAYGYRAAREADLSTPRWREDPQVLFATLKAQLERGTTEGRALPAALERVEKQIEARAAAERELEERLPAGPARAAARHLLARARRFIRLRERQRARVTEVLGFFRTVALEASRRIAQWDAGAGAGAAFYLEIDEVRAFLRGELPDVGALVAARRADVARDLGRPDPPSMFVGAPPPLAPSAMPAGDALTGIAASPGCVAGVARVMRDPSEGASLRPGEVLVTPVADVGWTPLFLAAAAVVTELGGALSHASLVAREYGVPAVVNVRGATRVIATGDRVRVDGDRGRVELLERAGSPANPSAEGPRAADAAAAAAASTSPTAGGTGTGVERR